MDVVFSSYISQEFQKWFFNYFSTKLSEESFKLYVYYASVFSNFIQKDFFLYTKEDADKYSDLLLDMIEQELIRPKTAYNQLAILSSIASALADTMNIPDFFSEQERPLIEHTSITHRQLPDTAELDLILSAAKKYDDSLVMYTALYLIGTYALSRAEILALSPDNIFLQDNKIIIRRKEIKVLGVALPKLIVLDNTSISVIKPLYEQMKCRMSTSNGAPVFLFCDKNGDAIKPAAFSYAYRHILKLAGFSNTYDLRQLRAGSLTRIARVGGSDALFETVGLSSSWGERYVAASSLLSSAQVINNSHSPNAYENFVLIPKNKLSSVLENAYHLMDTLPDANLFLSVSGSDIESTISCKETGATFRFSNGCYIPVNCE